MAAMASTALEDVDVVVRRSARKRRSAWREETLEMSIRTSRAKGDSELIAVKNLGGQPTHKKTRSTPATTPKATCARLKFCGRCGHKHLNDEMNFCCQCGLKRANKKTSGTAATSSAEARDDNSTTVIENIGMSVDEETESNEEKESMCANEKNMSVNEKRATKFKGKPKRLRCGWMMTEEHEFISPDGKRFSCRKDAARYYNKNVTKLEPARQDGWSVFVDESNTHVEWIAPDGQKLKSFIGAKTYARNSNLPIFGKDGLTKTIASFFGASATATPQMTGKNSAIDLTSTPTNAVSSNTTTKKMQTTSKTTATTKTPVRMKQKQNDIPKQKKEGGNCSDC